jgi:hypothetical protein
VAAALFGGLPFAQVIDAYIVGAIDAVIAFGVGLAAACLADIGVIDALVVDALLHCTLILIRTLDIGFAAAADTFLLDHTVTIEADIYSTGVAIFTGFVRFADCYMVVDAAELDASIEGRRIAIITIVVVLAAPFDRLSSGEVDVIGALVVDALIEGALVHILALCGAGASASGHR